MTGRGFPRIVENILELVFMGVGLAKSEPADEKSIVQVNEPIILAALASLLADHPIYNPYEVLNRDLNSHFNVVNPKLMGFAFEDIVANRLWDTLSRPGVKLSDVFEFAYLKPSWADSEVRLLSALSVFSSSGSYVLTPSEMTGTLVYEGNPQTSERSLAWFHEQDKHRLPFLKPDEDMGPDLLFGLRLVTGEEILVAVQCKCWNGEKKHYPGDVEDAVWKSSPEGGLYKSDPVSSLPTPECNF